MPDRAYLTPKQLADELDLTPAAIRMWCANRPGFGYRCGGRWRIPLANAGLAIRSMHQAAEGFDDQQAA